MTSFFAIFSIFGDNRASHPISTGEAAYPPPTSLYCMNTEHHQTNKVV